MGFFHVSEFPTAHSDSLWGDTLDWASFDMQISAIYRKLLGKMRPRAAEPMSAPSIAPEVIPVPEDEPVPERRLSPNDWIELKQLYSSRWDGVTKEETLRYGWGEERREWNDALENRDWSKVLDMIDKKGPNPNDWQLSGSMLSQSMHTALHMAADAAAPQQVVTALIALGGWRTIQNANGETPFDIAFRKKHTDLLDILKPVILHHIRMPDLLAMQAHFHVCLKEYSYVEEHDLRLPQLAPLLELDDPKMYFPIPGMYGGISYAIERAGADPKLVFDSRCRVVGGPVPRNEITVNGCTRVESVDFQ